MRYTTEEKQISGVGGYYDPYGNPEIEGSILSAGKALSAEAFGEDADMEGYSSPDDPLAFKEHEQAVDIYGRPYRETRPIYKKNKRTPTNRVVCTTGRRYIPGREMARGQNLAQVTGEKDESKVVSLPKKLSHRQIVSYLAQVAGRT